MAGVNYSTANHYKGRFPEFLPTVGKGKNRRYKAEAVQVVRFISNAYKSGADYHEVSQRLFQSYPVSVENYHENHGNTIPRNTTDTKKGDKASEEQLPSVVTERGNTMVITMMITKALEPILHRMNDVLEQNRDLIQGVADRDQEIRKMQKAEVALKKRLARLEAEVNKPWWKKIF